MADKNNIELVRLALAEAQATVRGYDTKAQIVGIGYLFALNVITRLADILPGIREEEINLLFVVVSWVLMILPVALFGFVLYPSRKTAPALESSQKNVHHVLYVNPQKTAGVDQYLEQLAASDEARELGFELLKVSHLRELKRRRFLRALFVTGLAMVLLFLAQMVRATV